MKYVFETRMMVRDYECDIEGIVNAICFPPMPGRPSSRLAMCFIATM